MTGSRDPIREYLEERRRQERRDLVYVIARWALMISSACIVLIMGWLMLVGFVVTFQ